MLANPPLARPSPLVRPKHVLFAFIGVRTGDAPPHNERFLIEPAHPLWEHYQPIKWWLYPHAFAGSCALLVAPFQFSDRLRRRYAKVHRVMGRVYVAGVLMLAPLGAYVQYLVEAPG